MASAPRYPEKPIVLVGLMGAGKTSVGQRLAALLDREFIDADREIEAAANCSIEDIFAQYGEPAFRDGERRVIARLMKRRNAVIATGGGAFADAETRRNVRLNGVSVWLKADLEILLDRVSRRNDRPLLNMGDRRTVMERLIAERYPCYAEADLTVASGDRSVDDAARAVLRALQRHFEAPHPA